MNSTRKMYILVDNRYYKVNSRANGTQYYTVKGKRQNVEEGADLVEEKLSKKERSAGKKVGVSDKKTVASKPKKVKVKMADDEFYSAKAKAAVKGFDITVEKKGNRYSLLAVDADGRKLRKFTSKATAEKFA
jgi:hypothetical protein